MTGGFEVLVLGCTGGPFESNLSSYALVDTRSKQAILLDAGTILTGLQAAFENGHLSAFAKTDSPFIPARHFLREHVKAILISHAHLDHILGLVLSSQIDSKKPILAVDQTIDHLKNHVFNNTLWANLSNEGEDPHELYHYERIKLGKQHAVAGTSMFVEAFLLNHELMSTAFLIQKDDEYVLYFGDTSSDFLEPVKRNEAIWSAVAPLVRTKKLKAIFIECSFPNSRELLYGHLKPELLEWELKKLQELADCPLEGLKVIVTHRKQGTRVGEDSRETVAKELSSNNILGVNYIFPQQGERIVL